MHWLAVDVIAADAWIFVVVEVIVASWGHQVKNKAKRGENTINHRAQIDRLLSRLYPTTLRPWRKPDPDRKTRGITYFSKLPYKVLDCRMLQQ